MIETTPLFQSVPHDQLEVKAYTLPNGLRLLMSVNRNEPRIFTNIAFRAGSKHDPADTTGLAHYMEHMLFKGTSRIGATNWKKEERLLTRIAGLYGKLAEITPSAIVELNRAVALAMLFGPAAGLQIVDALAAEPSLKTYHLLPSVRGDLLEKLGRHDEARAEFERAASLARNARERKLLLDRAEAAGR